MTESRKQHLKSFLHIAEDVNFADDVGFKRSMRKLKQYKGIAQAFKNDDDHTAASIGVVMLEIIAQLETVATTKIYEVAYDASGKVGQLTGHLFNAAVEVGVVSPNV